MAKKRTRTLQPVTHRMEAARRNRNKVIHERNLILLALARHAGFRAHICAVDDPGTWTAVLCIHTPAGQLHWRLSDVDQDTVKTLARVPNDHYDGCRTAEKLSRLEALHLFPHITCKECDKRRAEAIRG